VGSEGRLSAADLKNFSAVTTTVDSLKENFQPDDVRSGR
jgi:hypothetical protein